MYEILGVLGLLCLLALIAGLMAPRLLLRGGGQGRGRILLYYGSAVLLLWLVRAVLFATVDSPGAQDEWEQAGALGLEQAAVDSLPLDVESFSLGDDIVHKLMEAEECDALLGVENVARETTEDDPDAEGSMIITKVYRVDEGSFLIEFRRFWPTGPYLVSRIVILEW